MSVTAQEQKIKVEGIPLKRSERMVLIMDTPKGLSKLTRQPSRHCPASGRGIFASKDIPARTVLEISPVLVLDPVQNEEHVKRTELYNYMYNWPYTPPGDENSPELHSTKPPSTTQAVIFGLGSMFNHSALHQNVGWERDLKNLLVTFITLRDIEAGEELCISYGPRLTFKDCDADREPPPDDWTELQSIIDLID